MSELKPIFYANPASSMSRTFLHEAVDEVFASGVFILGNNVLQFEESFAEYLGSNHCVGVANGTDAITIALKALGVGQGDKVISVANTALPSIVGIRQAGAEVYYVDIDDYYTIDINQVEQLLQSDHEKKIKAVLAVHLYGQACDILKLEKICREYSVFLIEDCAQCHGASFNGKKLGTFGDLATFSFYPTKNLPCFGDGGAIVCNDPSLNDKLRLLRQYGWQKRNYAVLEGHNSRLDEFQACYLAKQLSLLEQHNKERSEIATHYLNNICIDCVLPKTRKDSIHVYHQFTILVDDRDQLLCELKDKHNITLGTLYDIPIHRQPAYYQETILEKTELFAKKLLNLPCYPGVNYEKVVEAINSFK